MPIPYEQYTIIGELGHAGKPLHAPDFNDLHKLTANLRFKEKEHAFVLEYLLNGAWIEVPLLRLDKK